ncbi:MAG: DUF1922 domain-containing protein [Promethearchaeota archaeon]
MEDIAWERDQTPYYVFTCRKCHQYMYVKTTQKTKKCLRCGRSHKVENIQDSSELVNGVSKAIEVVKTRQHELAIKTIGDIPDLRASSDFKVARSSSRSRQIKNIENDDDRLLKSYKKMLLKISSMYKKFPLYVIEVMADNFGIPSSEIKILTRNFLENGILIKLTSNSYKLDVERL